MYVSYRPLLYAPSTKCRAINRRGKKGRPKTKKKCGKMKEIPHEPCLNLPWHLINRKV